MSPVSDLPTSHLSKKRAGKPSFYIPIPLKGMDKSHKDHSGFNVKWTQEMGNSARVLSSVGDGWSCLRKVDGSMNESHDRGYGKEGLREEIDSA